MKKYLVIGIVFFALGIMYGGMHLAYNLGVKHGVEHTEQCMGNWGKMKHDGWEFYCLH